VDAEVLLEDPADLRAQLGFAPGARRRLGPIGAARDLVWYVDGAIGSTLQIGSTP
jgi:hypothetical protein